MFPSLVMLPAELGVLDADVCGGLCNEIIERRGDGCKAPAKAARAAPPINRATTEHDAKSRQPATDDVTVTKAQPT